MTKITYIPITADLNPATGEFRTKFLENAGLSMERLAKISEGGAITDKALFFSIMPELEGAKDPNSFMRIIDGTQKIREWRIKELGNLKEALDGVVNEAEKTHNRWLSSRVLLLKDLEALREGQAKLDEKERELKAAIEHRGVYASETERELNLARDQLKQLKGEGIMATMQGQIQLIRSQEKEIAELKRAAHEATEHTRTAWERLTDRFPRYTPFFSNIIEELKAALTGAPQ